MCNTGFSKDTGKTAGILTLFIKVVINKDGVVRKVKREKIEEMLQNGWNYGWNRKEKHKDV